MPKKPTRRKVIASAVLVAAVPSPAPTAEAEMPLGNFSVSLAVKDIQASKEFYEKLGFKVRAGNQKQNWLVLRNGAAIIGLFQGMFEKNVMTFNPGWDSDTKKLAEFTDVRDLQKRLKSQGVKLTTEVDEKGKGPGHFTVLDPDGNQLLFDQHV